MTYICYLFKIISFVSQIEMYTYVLIHVLYIYSADDIYRVYIYNHNMGNQFIVYLSITK